jgi:hypothetical protein
VPIIPFYHDTADDELYHLITYLQGAYEHAPGDLRDYNREAFHLEELAKDDRVAQNADGVEKDDMSIAQECDEEDRGIGLNKSLGMNAQVDNRRSRCVN